MTFDASGLGPGRYLREEIGVPNPLDGKFESWGLNILLPDYVFA